MSFQQSINNTMSGAVQVKGVQALQEQSKAAQEQSKIAAHQAQQQEMERVAQQALQTATDNKEAEGVKYPANYDKATDYYTGHLLNMGAEPSMVGHQIHQLSMEAGRNST